MQWNRPKEKRASLSLMILFCSMGFLTCEAPGSDDQDNLSTRTGIHIDFLGIVNQAAREVAAFSLVNDSTNTLQYFAYSRNYPHYSTEALGDTGWAYLSWNWCGTGAEYLPLFPGDSIHFYVELPARSCSWRVLLSVADTRLSWSEWIRSSALEHPLD